MSEFNSNVNDLNSAEAQTVFSQCCTSTRWIDAMVNARPFTSREAMNQKADQIWATLEEADFLEAFDGHPKIGDVSTLKAKYANTKAFASGEQSGVEIATDDIIQALKEANDAYDEKFGFIFIVCATGKSANEMLDILNGRLPNTRDQELQNAAEEQRKIFQIRLNNVVVNS